MSEDGRGLFAVGFNRFAQLTSGFTTIFVPELLSNRILVLSATWNVAVLQNADETITIRGGSLDEKEIILPWHQPSNITTRNGHFHENKLYLIKSDGKIEIYVDGLPDKKYEKLLICLNSYNMKQVLSTVNPDCLYGLTETGELYTWNETSLPTPISLQKQVTKLGCGIGHCLALVQDGTIFTWGTGSRGQLGHGSLQDESKPRQIDILCGVSIKAIAAGGWHSLALADTGDVYVWGWNECGQLGFPVVEDLDDRDASSTSSFGNKELQQTSVAMLNSPSLLELEKYLNTEDFISVKDISCGTRHTGVVSSNGEAVTWGWGKYGQLAHVCCMSSSDKSVSTPKDLELKRAKIDDTNICDCHEKAHLPDVVEYFKTRSLLVESVYCVAWNTFFKTVPRP